MHRMDAGGAIAHTVRAYWAPHRRRKSQRQRHAAAGAQLGHGSLLRSPFGPRPQRGWPPYERTPRTHCRVLVREGRSPCLHSAGRSAPHPGADPGLRGWHATPIRFREGAATVEFTRQAPREKVDGRRGMEDNVPRKRAKAPGRTVAHPEASPRNAKKGNKNNTSELRSVGCSVLSRGGAGTDVPERICPR